MLFRSASDRLGIIRGRHFQLGDAPDCGRNIKDCKTLGDNLLVAHRFGIERGRSAAHRCRRYGRPFGLLIVDLDGFKAVNDTAGHEAGDQVLQAVGRVIRENCRAIDLPARLGGDEFAVILPEASRLTVPRYAQKLVDLIGRAPVPPGLPRVTASVGAVAFERAPESVEAALGAADDAMYAAKRSGKNRVVDRKSVV